MILWPQFDDTFGDTGIYRDPKDLEVRSALVVGCIRTGTKFSVTRRKSQESWGGSIVRIFLRILSLKTCELSWVFEDMHW